jgi:hypothetical protein
MHCASRYLSSLLLVTAFLAPAVTTGCANRSYRVYDPYHNDYHRWDHHEAVYYHQWVTENHREDRDFRKLNKDDQKQYWDWRHNHHE